MYEEGNMKFTHKHKHNPQHSHKVILHVDNQNRICIKLNDKLEEIGEPFLNVHDYPVTRTVTTMNGILNYAKKELTLEKYLQVEKFFMEKVS